MLEQFQAIYTTRRWVKYTTCLGVSGGGALLLWYSGGFPPPVWRFLLQALPLIPRLWTLKGPLMLLPLSALLLHSFTLLFFWLLLTTAIIWIVKEQWSYLRERQLFEASLLKAQNQATNDGEGSVCRAERSGADIAMGEGKEQWWLEQTAPMPQAARKVASQAPFPAVSPVATLYPPPPKQNDAPPIVTVSRQQMMDGEGSVCRAERSGADIAMGEEMADTGTTGAERHFKLAIGTGLDPGIKRKHKPNEDRLLAIQGTLASDTRAQPFGLFVIADGIGGHANGQEASRIAIQNIRDTVIPALLGDVKIDEELSAELLKDAIHEANRAVCEYNHLYKTDTGTTVTAALIVDKTVSIANVGDSRTYAYSKLNGLTRVTRDHSVVARMVENGSITAEDVYSHPRRNEIYRSLGHKVDLEVDMYRLPLERETTLLLCSDGLWEMVRDPDMQEILDATLPHSVKTSKALVQAALEGGGHDNISVIVVHII